MIKSCREKSEIWCKSITKNVKSFLKTTQTNHGKVMIMIIPHLWSKVKVGAECLMNCRIIKKLSRSLDARIIFWSNIWYGSPFGTPDSSKQWSSRNGQCPSIVRSIICRILQFFKHSSKVDEVLYDVSGFRNYWGWKANQCFNIIVRKRKKNSDFLDMVNCIGIPHANVIAFLKTFMTVETVLGT